MGKQIGRQRIQGAIGAFVLGQRGGCDQRTDVELNRGFASVEQPGQPGHGRVQGVLPCVGQCDRRAQQCGCQIAFGQCNTACCLPDTAAANGAVGVIAGVIIGDDGVGIVVTTKHKEADQCLVVSGFKCSGLAHRGQVQREGQRSTCHGQAARAA